MDPLNTVNKSLIHWSVTEPKRPAFIFYNSHLNSQRYVLSRRDLFALSARFAAILRDKGVTKGDIVCNTLANSPERLVTDMGIMLAGAVSLSGMLFLADGLDLLGVLRRSRCVALIVDPDLKGNALDVLQNHLDVDGEKVSLKDAPNFKLLFRVNCTVDQNGSKPFLEDLRNHLEIYNAQVQPEDLAFIFTTSGSTGFSKMVPRTHQSFLAVGETIYELSGSQPGDVYYNDRSLGRISGAPTQYVSKGITRVMLDESCPIADPLKLMWKAVELEKCTVGLTIPLLLDKTMARPELWKEMGQRLRVLVIGGQQIRRKQTDAIGKVTDSLTITYGCTETGMVTVLRINGDNLHESEDGNNGLPLSGMEVKLVNEDGQEVKEPGTAGEILVRGPPVFLGYLGLQEKPQQVLQDHLDVLTVDGWFRTKDVGYLNSKGELHVVCRKSNAINHGAFILYPGWLETRVEKCPGVRHVVIVPVPDPTVHQELCACVVPEEGVKVTADDVREFCKSLFLTSDTSDVTQIPR